MLVVRVQRFVQRGRVALLGLALPLVLPLPGVLAGFRISSSIALILVVAAEMIGAQVGIGAFVLTAGNLMQTDQLIAGVFVLSLLGLATIALLVLDPWYSRDFGFALSVCATAGLVLGSGPLAALLRRCMPRPLAVALAVPLAAQLACQPVLVLLEPVVPVYGVPANLLAAPAAPVATMAGLAGCLLLPVLPSAGYGEQVIA